MHMKLAAILLILIVLTLCIAPIVTNIVESLTIKSIKVFNKLISAINVGILDGHGDEIEGPHPA